MNWLKRKIKNIKQKIRLWFIDWLNISTIEKEIQYNLIQINALEKYTQNLFDLNMYVFEKCNQYNITDQIKIQQIKENRKRKLYYDYHNEFMKDLVKNNLEEIKFF